SHGGSVFCEPPADIGAAVRAARNAPPLVAPRGPPPAEITSHGTRCHDRDPHLALSASKTFVCPKTSTLEVPGWRIGSFTSDGHTCRFTSNSDRTDASQRIVAQCHTGRCGPHLRSPYRPSKVRRAARRKRYHFGACQCSLQRCFPAELASGR